MSRRNKKKRMYGFVLPTPFAVIVVAGVLVALLYVWLGNRCDSLGKDIKTLEAEKNNLKKELVNQESRWTSMKSPGSMEQALSRHNIVMTWPRQDQVVRLNEPRHRQAAVIKKVGSSFSYVKREKVAIHD